MIQSPVLNTLRAKLKEDKTFDLFVRACAVEKVSKEMKKLAKNKKLRLPCDKFSSQKLSSFSFTDVNQQHQAIAPFTIQLLRCCINRSDITLRGTKDKDAEELPEELLELRDDMPREDVLLSKRRDATCNCALVAVVALCMLCYGCNKRSNLLQTIIRYFAFANNVPKRCMEVLHQMGLFTSYEQILRTLRANKVAVETSLAEKVAKDCFFISYDNMNFYEHARDQRIINRGEIVNYTAGYVCFIKTPNSPNSSDNN